MTTRRERAKAQKAMLNKQLAETEEASNLRAVKSRKHLHTAEIYIDVAKLFFGGVTIGSLINQQENWKFFLVLGTALFFIFLWIGNNYYNRGNKIARL